MSVRIDFPESNTAPRARSIKQSYLVGPARGNIPRCHARKAAHCDSTWPIQEAPIQCICTATRSTSSTNRGDLMCRQGIGSRA